MAFASSVIGIVAIIYLFSFVIGIVMYLLQAFGLYNMGKSLGLQNPWLSFIPVANLYAFGKIAEQYIKADGRKSAKFSKILLTLYIILFVILIAFLVFMVAIIMMDAMSDPNVNAYFESEEFAATAVFTFVIPLLLGYFALLGVAIALSIVEYIAMWRIFAIFDNDNATLYLVLSIFFSFLSPIFIFVLRNREPRILFAQQPEIM